MGTTTCRINFLLLTIGLCLFYSDSCGFCADSLSVRIDELIAAKQTGQPTASKSDDAEFLRRVFLDLAGRIPMMEEARAFLSDSATDKREKLIDRLLASVEFPRRMAEWMHVMLLERRGEHQEWQTYLKASFERNKPWDLMVREMLAPDPNDETTRGAAFFLSKRLENYGQNPVDYPTLTRDVSRLFLGMDLQCAQCHDHLFVKDYKQEDFQGMYVVFLNTSLRNDVKFPAVSEKLLTQKIEFQSVFNSEKKSIGPRVPGRDEIVIPTFAKGEEYLETPDKKTRNPGRPKFSPLASLAEEITSPQNPLFARNTANRIWFALMGRGLVHPLDLHHSENPPSHPELLDLLASQLIEHKFDLKWLIRELALTQTYQRSSLLPEGLSDPLPERYQVAIEKPLSAEQLFLSTLHAGGLANTAQNPTLDAKFEPLRAKFLKAFANPPLEPEGDFAPSLRAALFLMNDADMLKLLYPQPRSLINRLESLPSAEAMADELFLSVLSRRSTSEEAAELAAQLQQAGDRRRVVLQQFAWSLLASTEFCVNH